MAEGEKKSQPGPSGARTVASLNPIRYQLRLVYMGRDRVTRGSTYRCKCELKKGETPQSGPAGLPPLELIPNLVHHTNPDEDALKAAHPYNEGAPPGDNTNPSGDQVYRLAFTDNHAIPGGQDLETLLGRKGDGTSKIDHYLKQGWMPDVLPAVPFRVVVRKFSGGTPVPLDTPVRVLIEIKDPAEEIEVHPLRSQKPRKTRPRKFLEKFFARHNQPKANPTRGGDNDATVFRGLRDPSASHPGVQGTDVIRVAPYHAHPLADRPSGEPAKVGFEEFTPATSHQGSHKIVLDVTKVQETVDKKKVAIGVADFALTPWKPALDAPTAVPAGGDNYRFLLTLIDDQDQDVRTREEGRKRVSLIDHVREDLPLPRAYVTGRFVVWRRLDIRLVATVNGTGPGAVNWRRLRDIYGRSFIEIGGPPARVILDQTDWEGALLRQFPDLSSNPAFNDKKRMEGEFQQWLFPTLVHDRLVKSKKGLEHTRQMARTLIETACRSSRLNPRVNQPPTVNTKQTDSEGLFVLICKPPMPDVQVPGEYLGDRMFWMADSGNQGLAGMICAHEIGHALYLRHSYDADLTFEAREFKGSELGGKPFRIRLIRPTRPSRAYVGDHDQRDALGCLMSQVRPLDAEPCGLCTLVLRFYDRVRLQSNYSEGILAGLRPVRIMRVELRGARQVDLFRKPGDLIGSGPYFFMALGRRVRFVAETGQKFRGRVVLTHGDGVTPAMWKATGKGQLKINPNPKGIDVPLGAISVMPAGRGKARLNFSWKGITAVTPEFEVM